MSFMGFLKKKSPLREQQQDRGILVFDNTSEVIHTENALKSAGWNVRVKGPPPEIRTGCDLVIEFPLIEELNVLRVLAGVSVKPRKVVPVQSVLLEPVNLFHTKDFGQYLMIRAVNMKLTVYKKTSTIVNISGGGCPDVPPLAQEMVGKALSEAPSPRAMGHTLCGYALQLAYEEMQRQCSR